jgi:2-polyprenyl-3-methyl-5-hydroxy-6-metoxy-1,4-benzoquinol methylase
MKRNIIDPERAKHFVIERVLMDGSNPDLERESVIRYKFASQWTEGKKVVDAACGVGYGVKYLRASDYLGLDISKEAIESAKLFGGKYRLNDLDKVKFPECDVIVSFETVEHLENPLKFIEKASKAAKVFIFSTPNNESPGDNPFHKWIFNENELKALVEPFFKECEWFHQERDVINPYCYPGYIIGVCKSL